MHWAPHVYPSTLACTRSHAPPDMDEESEDEEPMDLEEEERAIAAMALHISASHEPNNTVQLGPGSRWGLPRYIGVMRPRHL